MVASAAESRPYTLGGSSWAHAGAAPVYSATTYQRANTQRDERVRLEKELMTLAKRVREVEAQVRDHRDMMGAVAANADKRVTELLWEAESLKARDSHVGQRLEVLKTEIAAKKQLVEKEFAGYIPKDVRIDFFTIEPRKQPAESAAGTAKGAGSITTTNAGKMSHASKSPRPEHKWQQEMIKRAGERAVKDSKIRERAEMHREEMRGGHGPLSPAGPGGKGGSDLASHFITREAWLSAHAEENAALLEERLKEKERELKVLDKSIGRQKRLLKQQKQLDKIHDEELQFGKPTHRHDRVPREHVNIAGTREVEYIQQALHAIMVDPNDTLRGRAGSQSARHHSGELYQSMGGTGGSMTGRWRQLSRSQHNGPPDDALSTTGVAQEIASSQYGGAIEPLLGASNASHMMPR